MTTRFGKNNVVASIVRPTIVGIFVALSGCSKPVQTVSWYEAHARDRFNVIDTCKNNPGELGRDPNCINAKEAEARYEATPEFQARAQVMEGEILSERVRKAVQTYYGQNKKLPTDNLSIGLPEAEYLAGIYVDRITLMDGYVNVAFKPTAMASIAGKVLTYVPTPTNGNLNWICEGLDSALLPRTCGGR